MDNDDTGRARSCAPEDWTYVRPDRLALQESPIERLRQRVSAVPGIISLETGESDVTTPDFICSAATQAIHQGRTFYSHGRGILPLRKAIATYHQCRHHTDVAEERIAVTSSGMMAIMLVGQAVLRRGDAAVVIGPAWPNVSHAFEVLGADVVHVGLDCIDGSWSLDLDRLFDACASRVRLIYLASPGNPTGWTADPDIARRIIRFARSRDIAVLADEVYHRLVGASDSTFSMLQASTPEDPVFVVNSFSKTYAMTGWRAGWLIFPTGLDGLFEKLVEFNHCGGVEFIQHGALAALRDGEDFVRWIRSYCHAGQRVVMDRLGRMPGVQVLDGQPGFFTLFRIADADRFCAGAVTTAGLALAPGSAFGVGTTGMVRICHARSPKMLSDAMDRLEAMLSVHARRNVMLTSVEVRTPRQTSQLSS